MPLSRALAVRYGHTAPPYSHHGFGLTLPCDTPCCVVVQVIPVLGPWPRTALVFEPCSWQRQALILEFPLALWFIVINKARSSSPPAAAAPAPTRAPPACGTVRTGPARRLGPGPPALRRCPKPNSGIHNKTPAAGPDAGAPWRTLNWSHIPVPAISRLP